MNIYVINKSKIIEARMMMKRIHQKDTEKVKKHCDKNENSDSCLQSQVRLFMSQTILDHLDELEKNINK